MAEINADIVIVGAGMAGAATAYHLKRMSDRKVVILEKEAVPGEHSSGRNVAFIREYAEEAPVRPLTRRGATFLREGNLAEYNRCGSMLLGIGDEDVSKYFALAEGRGRWCPEDGVLDVAGLLRSYLSGQDVRLNTEVLDWRRDSGWIRVQTNTDAFVCGVLVNAAGPWAGQFGRLPLTPKKRHVYVTRPMPEIKPGWPFVWDTKNALYFRPESGGLLLSPCDEIAAEPGDYAEDPAMLEDLHDKLARLQPRLTDLAIARSWVGQRTFAEDRCFVIGFDPRESGLFHVAGLGGHGVTASYAVGQTAAALLLGRQDEHGDTFAPSRLLGRGPSHSHD